MGADHNSSTSNGRLELSAGASLQDKILVYLNSSSAGLTFAQIYDGVKPAPGHAPSLDVVRQVASAVYELSCENLISCSDLFAEPGNGSARERDVLYKMSHRGKMHLLGLVLLNTNDNGDVAEAGPSNSALVNHPIVAGFSVKPPSPPKIADASPVPATTQEFIRGGTGGEASTLLTSPPSLSVITTKEMRVARVMAALPVPCPTCGRPATKLCACGKEVCIAHWYDADGATPLSDADGMCGECVEAVREQTWGESRHGIAGRV